MYSLSPRINHVVRNLYKKTFARFKVFTALMLRILLPQNRVPKDFILKFSQF
jgi:hypothetical protein